MNDLEKLAVIINNAFEKLYAKIDALATEIKKQPVPEVKVSPPEVNVNIPDVVVPEMKLPELPPYPEFPPFPEFPEIKVPQPIVNIEKSDPPIVNVEAPIVNIPPANITIEPKIDFPKEIKVQGMEELLQNTEKQGIKDISSQRPLPVMVINEKGRRVSDFGGDFSAPSLVGLKNNADQPAQINPATEETATQIVGDFLLSLDYDIDNNLIYQGRAVPGSSKAAAVWQIRKFTYVGTNLVDIQWADGDTNFDNIWNNRAIINYA